MSNKKTEYTEILYHQPGHLKGITKIQEIGNYIFTGGEDGRICIWDSDLNEEIGCLYAHKFSVNDIQKLNGEDVIITVSNDLELKLWSLKNFSQIFSRRAHASAIIGGKSWKDFVITASRDHMLKKWKYEKSSLIEETRIKIPDMERFFLCDDTIITTDQNGLISILKVEDFSQLKYNTISKKKLIRAIRKAGKYIKDFENKDPHTILFNISRRYGIPSTVCTTTKDFFILGHQFGLVSFWRKDNGKMSDILFLHNNHITGIQPLDDKLLTTALDSTIIITDIKTATPINKLKLPSRPLSLKKSSNKQIIIGLESGEIVVLNNQLEIIQTKQKIVPITGSCVTPDFLAVAFSDGEIQLLDTKLQNIRKKKIHNKKPLNISYYDNRLITIGEDKQIHFLDKELSVTKTISLSQKPIQPKQARQYITINSNHVLDLNKDEVMKGEISRATEKQLEDVIIPKHVYQNGDLSILINEQSLKETDSKKLLDFYSEDVILSIGNLAKNSRNAKYKRVAETTILRSES